MFETFYGFGKRAFPAVPDRSHFFPIEELEAAQSTLGRVISQGEGPGVVIGPPGVGKTLLCDLLEEEFRSEFHVVTLACGQLRELQDMLQSIVHQLRLPHQGQNVGELRLTLLDFLEPSAECPNGMLLLVDEAQHLSTELLEEVRMICNFVRNGSPRVRAVLMGSARLEETLTDPKLESLNQRIAARCFLQGMTREESRRYITGLTATAGGDVSIWLEDALRAIYDASAGVPRVTNQVAHRALELGAEQKARQINAAIVQQAWSDIQQLPTPWVDEPQAESESVIEFGGLDDSIESIETSEATSCEIPAETGAIEFGADCVAEQAEVISSTETVIANDAATAVHSTNFVQYELTPDALERVNQIEARLVEVEAVCGETEPPLAASPDETVVDNPFGDFPQEEVVLDEHLELGSSHQTVGPRVSNMESRLLAETLDICRDMDVPNAETGVPAAAEPQPLQEEMTLTENDRAFNQREIGFDGKVEQTTTSYEPATVVPIFAATRDDRDMIIIEDDHSTSLQNRDVIHQLRGN